MKIMLLCLFIGGALGYPEGRTTETKKDVCKMKPPVELGHAISPGWFYNDSLDLCQYYEFGAHKHEKEKSNRFSSLLECSKTCRSHVPSFCFDTPKKTGKKATNLQVDLQFNPRGSVLSGTGEPKKTKDSKCVLKMGKAIV
uniref:Putative tick kunitz 99 n=1 Tax=Ixodes ricinus TaxID=34613 RepID=V5ICH8_IXORI